MYDFLESTHKICPVCKGKNSIEIASTYKNVYSELISKEYGVVEGDLINKMNSIKCVNCKTYFWENRLSKECRQKLYTKILPVHPKGEDSTGDHFNLKSLEDKVKGLNSKSSKRERILNGYISSMLFNTKKEKDEISNLIYEDTYSNESKRKLDKIFKRGAKPYTRHSGFRNTSMNQAILNDLEISKDNNYQYIEYGCLDWGPINCKSIRKYKCLSIIPENSIFWTCDKKVKAGDITHDVKHELDLNRDNYKLKDSILSLILVLDHLEKPYEFLLRFKELGVKKIIILIEKINLNKGMPIQHLTGWEQTSLKNLSNLLGFKINFTKLETDYYIQAELTR